MAQVWLITGCSSGFSRIFVTQVLFRRDKVIATGRTIAKIAPIRRRRCTHAAGRDSLSGNTESKGL